MQSQAMGESRRASKARPKGERTTRFTSTMVASRQAQTR